MSEQRWCARFGCVDIRCRPSPKCASGNHCVERTMDGFLIIRDAKDPTGKPVVLTLEEFQKLEG